MEDSEAQLQLKKRARRRLVGAVFFVSVAAVVLPMVMDQEPRQVVQDVEIRIPGQDEKPFAPRFAVEPPPADAAPAEPVPSAERAPQEAPVAKVEKPAEKPAARPADKPAEKPADKAPAKAQDKPSAKPAEKPAEKAAEKPKADDAKRAAALLAGKTDEKAAAKGGEFLVLIGAFSNEDNVRVLKSKLGELGIRVYTEPLDTPQGKKTRVRAGPFPSREAADKALERMKKIGVGGVVAAKS
jgi:DedD protein